MKIQNKIKAFKMSDIAQRSVSNPNEVGLWKILIG